MIHALAYTRKFRLNEGLTATLTSASNLASLPLLLLCGLAISASRLFAAPTSAAPSNPLIATSPGSSVLPVLAFCVTAAAVLGGWVVRAKGLAESAGVDTQRAGSAAVAATAAASGGKGARAKSQAAVRETRCCCDRPSGRLCKSAPVIGGCAGVLLCYAGHWVSFPEGMLSRLARKAVCGTEATVHLQAWAH
eukprot:1159098-Pelagomonas_calceolata.AAC.14